VRKVAIVGCGGSGKSYLAGEHARLIEAPLTHLDAEYFDDQWNPLPMERFKARQRDLVAAPRWVIDGNYNSTLHVRLEAADTVIFMDLPTRSCVRGILGRQLRHGRGQNSACGVYNRITREVLRYVLDYRRTMRPQSRTKIR
jgi:adenylate kinase family enzyme